MFPKRVVALILLVGILFISSCATIPRQAQSRQPLVVLLTDFGERDHYVGAMKGAIYSADPAARIDCITNQIRKFDIVEGAYTLAEAAQEYPDGTIFVGVVDPGVGSARKGIVIRTKNGKLFVGPDNGLFSIAAMDAGIVEVRELTNTAFMRPGPISSTFHGRDIFGPVAGHLAAGAPLESVGPLVSDIVKLPVPEASLERGTIRGMVLHIDGYGNIITNIPVRMVEEIGITQGSHGMVTVGGSRFSAQYVKTYSSVNEGTPLFLSNKGMVEIAMNKRPLAAAVRAEQGSRVTLSRWNGPDVPISTRADTTPK